MAFGPLIFDRMPLAHVLSFFPWECQVPPRAFEIVKVESCKMLCELLEGPCFIGWRSGFSS